MVVVIKKFSVLFYTKFEKSKPSSVNFAGFFCIFQSCLLVCHFLFWFWLRWYYFPKNLVKVYCIHFCLPFFFPILEKKSWNLLSVVSVFLPLIFTICKFSSFFFQHFSPWKMIWHFFLLWNLSFLFPFRLKNFQSSEWVKTYWFQ